MVQYWSRQINLINTNSDGHDVNAEEDSKSKKGKEVS